MSVPITCPSCYRSFPSASLAGCQVCTPDKFPTVLAGGGCATIPLTVMVKLGTLAVHIGELQSPGATISAAGAIRALLNDAELQAWLRKMTAAGMLPVKR